jgi:peptide/nickel transport system ATP-binding protein
MSPVLAVQGLTVALPSGADRRFAVEDVSFEVYPGEIVCLAGESGSGKSITGLSIMGLLPRRQLHIAAGSVRVEGEDVVTATPERLRELRGSRMSMVFQEPMTALNPVVTVGSQIAEVLQWHAPVPSRTAIEERVLGLMADVRLPEPDRLRHAYPHQLSGGQRQRVVIAMALALEPALIIADEPTTALDVTTQAQILALLHDLQDRHGSAILFITHDFGVVAEIADRVIVMQSGRIVESGPTEALLTRPKHAYTQMLLAAVPKGQARSPQYQPDAPTVLAIDGLSKRFRSGGFLARSRVVQALDDVNLSLRRGEILGVVGESGSGKSTMARCIARFMEPSAGQIVIDGIDMVGLSARQLRPFRRRIQMIFQDPYRSLNPRRSVGQSILEGPINYGVERDEAERRMNSLLKLVGMEESAAERYPHAFSGGQRQRLCIARALAMEPEILIADEAVSALDVSVQAQVLDLLDDIRQRLDLTILFITHDLRVAARLCDTIAVMFRGQVVETGPAIEIFARPQHDYTRALFASAPGHDFGARANGRQPSTAIEDIAT